MINKIIEELNPKKSTGLEKISPKMVKISASTINSHFTNIMMM